MIYHDIIITMIIHIFIYIHTLNIYVTRFGMMDLTYTFRFEAQSGINSTPHSIQPKKKSTGRVEGNFSPKKSHEFVSFRVFSASSRSST